MRGIAGCMAVLFFGACISSRAQGGLPLVTDDTDTPGNGKREVVAAVTSELRHAGKRLFEAPLLDMNYGVGEHLELNGVVGWLVSANRNKAVVAGLSDATLGVKWRFLDEAEAPLAVSVFPKFTFNNPTSSVRRGLATNGQECFVPLEFQKTLDPLEVGLEAGPDFHFNTSNEWDYGIVIGRSFGKFELVGEIHGSALEFFRRDDLILNLGVRYQIREGCTLLLAAGRSIHDDGTAPVTLSSFVGIRFNF
ncbi:MAG TPA: hypothetical protein VGD78_12110 [Chthoniobacterales bacterium]